MAAQPLLFDMTPYLPREGTILGAVDDAQAEQRAEIERAAEELAEEIAAEEEQAERDAEGIRAMLTADLPAGAADRWAAAFGSTTATDPADGVRLALVTTVDSTVRVHAETCPDTPKDATWFVGTVAHRVATCKRDLVASVGVDADQVVWHRCCYSLPEEAPAVDVDALQMSPMVRRMLVDLDGRRWHYQTRKGALSAELVTDIKATKLTPYGERVRSALLAK
ncbi:hypothetical protein [Nocardiopsis tropica]|uniref:Uncharacterized protein n=1 Tax=Nocardiopsis tropica TaxID=109330 RepID=A0ABU7KLZ6_9ACTN|nr:hypothetical protein [Nocardiopsis umidischolae]MEE2050314.1 hypothetical protein [Nocardiopsis umidischolae]